CAIIVFVVTLPSARYTLSLHDALPICAGHRAQAVWRPAGCFGIRVAGNAVDTGSRLGQYCDRPARRTGGENPAQRVRRQGDRCRSEEHTSELQSRENLVCRLLLEKKKT